VLSGYSDKKFREKKMKSGLLAAVAAGGLLFAAPASAQGVKIGILNDQSGVYADYGGKWSFEAAKMAIEDFGGEVLGHKIEIVSADHQNKPDLGSAIARRWYDVENVDMITELTTSSVALAVHELSKEKKKIDIVVGAATSRLTGDACQPYGFHWAYDTHALAFGTGGSLVEAGGDSWFFMTADYAFGYALEKDTADFVKAKGGKVVGSVRVPLNSSDSPPSCCRQSSKAKIVGLANAGQMDLPVCERNMPGKKTNLPEYEIICPGCFRSRTLLSHGRARAAAITPGYRLHAPSE
jgi:branched-chain amino acid transport system substrate-binding protein